MDKPFWGECDVKICCEGKGLDHCGLCADFPCDVLKSYSYSGDEHADNGARIEQCRSWANYEKHGITVCELTADEVVSALEKENTLILAACADNRVTTRAMSHVNDGLCVYFQTGEHYLKTQQIKANPNVALSVGNYEIEGRAEIIGHPMDESNRQILEMIKDKHPNAAERWSALSNQVVIKVKIKLVRHWRYVDGKPYIAIGHF
jgi:general stress protein 26